ncbi:unnamed protein product [Angiostrongylus costaricensis]|uniref:Uncharacterized protein n=1 Tax=Angiostrongylus costaricensis TaxID=334426 RepID=A0A0R3PBF9_ANGCS|nr:unnamed protein product [Angiostrongylus costaricensis]
MIGDGTGRKKLAEGKAEQTLQWCTRHRVQKTSQARIFDLPKFAPTARIIRLSSIIRQEKHKKGRGEAADDSLLRDAAGSFDNFDAFDLEELEASSDETMASRKKAAEQPPSNEENVGEFFPESS